MTKQDVLNAIEQRPARSAWGRGVKSYAYDLIEKYEGEVSNLTECDLLDGASDWHQFSWEGNALCYDWQIAESLCAPWELKRTKYGELRPNSHEEWLDVQARALSQAAQLILGIVHS